MRRRHTKANAAYAQLFKNDVDHADDVSLIDAMDTLQIKGK